jgi:hypothetical protein
MDANGLLKEVETLRSQLKTAQIQITELSSTVSEQQSTLE